MALVEAHNAVSAERPDLFKAYRKASAKREEE
jgi:hypothetical protein